MRSAYMTGIGVGCLVETGMDIVLFLLLHMLRSHHFGAF